MAVTIKQAADACTAKLKLDDKVFNDLIDAYEKIIDTKFKTGLVTVDVSAVRTSYTVQFDAAISIPPPAYVSKLIKRYTDFGWRYVEHGWRDSKFFLILADH